jgi:adenylate cyclase, class 2
MATNLEIEVKLRVRNPPDLLRRLRKIGARDHGRVFEENTLYDTLDGDFRRCGRLLRLRIETAQDGHREAKLTSKAPPQPDQDPRRRRKSAPRHKVRLEREADIRDPARTARLLQALGLRPSFRYEKCRTSFRHDGLHLDLDETPVGTFLELEGRPAAIDRVAKKLGYTPGDYIRGTYWGLYVADCRRRGQKPKNMVFAHKNHRHSHSLLDNLRNCF